MIIIYIVFGFILVILSVYLLDKRDWMSRQIRDIKSQRQVLEDLNKQLDESQEQLDIIGKPLEKVNDVSQKILKHMK